MNHTGQMQREEQTDSTSASATQSARGAASTTSKSKAYKSPEMLEHAYEQFPGYGYLPSLDRINEVLDSTIESVRRTFWNEETQSLTTAAIFLLGTGVGAAVGLLSKSKSLRKGSSIPHLMLGAASGLITASILTSDQRNEITKNISSLLNVAMSPSLRSTPKSEELRMEKIQTPPEKKLVVEAVSLSSLLSPIEHDEETNALLLKVYRFDQLEHYLSCIFNGLRRLRKDHGIYSVASLRES